MRCLHGKVDTTISCNVYKCCWLQPVFRVHGLWPWFMVKLWEHGVQGKM